MAEPSKKVVQAWYEGKEVTDSLGNKFRLRKPNILDMYDLMNAVGDVKNNAAMNMNFTLLHIATINGEVLESPKSASEVRAGLQRVGLEGFTAVSDFLNQDAPKNEQEAIDAVKK